MNSRRLSVIACPLFSAAACQRRRSAINLQPSSTKRNTFFDESAGIADLSRGVPQLRTRLEHNAPAGIALGHRLSTMKPQLGVRHRRSQCLRRACSLRGPAQEAVPVATVFEPVAWQRLESALLH